MRFFRGLGGLTALVLASTAGICSADIYSYTDKNGVRHISNTPDDPRYKVVMETPEYSKPSRPTAAEQAPPQAEPGIAAVVEPSTDAIQINGGGWKLISPSSDPQATLTGLGGDNYLHWGKSGKTKRFAVDQRQRKRLTGTIARIAAKNRLDPHLLHAVITAESAFNPKAVSRAGAMGLMQLMPATAERFGVGDPFDPVANIRGGAEYLRWLMKFFKNNLNLALAGYNAGENAVVKYGHKIPPYKETQNYVIKVLELYRQYRRGRS